MRLEYDDMHITGWVLKTVDGSCLYRGNPNEELRNMRMGSFGYACICGYAPIIKATKREALEVAREWNGLVHKCMKGHVGRDGRPLPCIGKDQKVKPVKVEIACNE